jgi:hypothetical protein
MISFRVTDEEFELLKVKSESQGARSISDYARAALCESAGAQEGLRSLRDEVQRLGARVERVTELLEAAEPAARPGMSLTTRKTRGA